MASLVNFLSFAGGRLLSMQGFEDGGDADASTDDAQARSRTSTRDTVVVNSSTSEAIEPDERSFTLLRIFLFEMFQPLIIMIFEPFR